jgi:hypothetical protein
LLKSEPVETQVQVSADENESISYFTVKGWDEHVLMMSNILSKNFHQVPSIAFKNVTNFPQKKNPKAKSKKNESLLQTGKLRDPKALSMLESSIQIHSTEQSVLLPCAAAGKVGPGEVGSTARAMAGRQCCSCFLSSRFWLPRPLYLY